jgi:hypothetical protein
MNHTTRYVIALALVLIIGGGYLLYTYSPNSPALSNTATSTTAGTDMKVTNIYDDTATYQIEAHYPQFGIPSVDAKIKDVVDAAIAEFKTYPANPPQSAVPKNEFTSSFNSAYVGPDVISVALVISEYTGGAHPNSNILGVNVDPVSGKEIVLEDVLKMIGKSLTQVATESLAQVVAKIGEDATFPEGADAKPENYGTFLISKDKVVFIFNSYQIAPYAAGPQSAEFVRIK